MECGLEVDEAEYVRESVNPALVEVVHAWAEQLSFVDICALTNVLEGSIVRCITRLDETCKDMRSAAKVIGDQPLYDKMHTASALIRRYTTSHTHSTGAHHVFSCSHRCCSTCVWCGRVQRHRVRRQPLRDVGV